MEAKQREERTTITHAGIVDRSTSLFNNQNKQKMGRRYSVSREIIVKSVPTVAKRTRPPALRLNVGEGKVVSKPVTHLYEGRFPWGVSISPEQFILDLPFFQAGLEMSLLNPETPEKKMYNGVRYVEFKFHEKKKRLQWTFAINLDNGNMYRSYLRGERGRDNDADFMKWNAVVASYYNMTKFNLNDDDDDDDDDVAIVDAMTEKEGVEL